MGRWMESPIITAILTAVLVGGMAAGIAAAVASEHPPGGGRGAGGGEEVALAVSFSRLEAVSIRDGLPLADALGTVAAAGVSSLIVEERTLVDLAARGDVLIRWGRELRDDLRLTGGGGVEGDAGGVRAIPPDKLFLRTPREDLHHWLKTALEERWGAPAAEWRHPVSGETWLAVTVPEENPVHKAARRNRHRYEFSFDDEELPYHLMHLPLGFRSGDFETASEAGLRPMVKLTAAGAPGPDLDAPGAGIDASDGGTPHGGEQWIRRVLGPAAHLPPGTLIIPGKDGLPGGYAATELWVRFLSESDWNLGVIPGSAFPGQAQLAEAVHRRLVPVHPVWPEEPESRTADAVVNGRARVLTFDWFMTLEGRHDDPATLSADRLQSLAARLEGAGFSLGSGGSPLPAGDLPPWAGLLMAGSLAGAAVLLVFSSPASGRAPAWARAGALAGAAAGMAAWSISPGLGGAFVPALLSAAVFAAPAAALAGGVNIAAAVQRHARTLPGDRALPVPASMAGAAAAVAVAVLGGVLASAFMTHPLHRAGLAGHRSMLLAGAASVALAAFLTRRGAVPAFPMPPGGRGSPVLGDGNPLRDAGAGGETAGDAAGEAVHGAAGEAAGIHGGEAPGDAGGGDGRDTGGEPTRDAGAGAAGDTAPAAGGPPWPTAAADRLKSIAARPITFGHLAAAGLLAAVVFAVLYRALNLPPLPQGPTPPGGSLLDMLLTLPPGVPETALGTAALYFSLRLGGFGGGPARTLGLAAAAGFAGIILATAQPVVPLAVALGRTVKGFAAGLAIVGLISFARFIWQRGGHFSPDGGFYDAES